MPRTMAAVFGSRPEAERVAQTLENEGIDRRRIRIGDTSTRQEYERGGERRSGGFWSWLFGTDEADAWNSDVDYYDEGMGRGGAILTVDADDTHATRVQELLEAQGGRVEAQGGRVEAGGRGQAAAGREQVLPVVEEQLRIGKRAVTRGGVRIYTRVTERPVEEDVRLREDRVHVDRRPVDRPTPAGAEAFRERSFEVEEMHEEPVVAKEARIIEEVVVTKDVQDRSAKVRDTVRRTDVEVERGDAGEFEADFRTHCNNTFGGQGLSYEQCAPAYRYGYSLGSDRRSTQSDWKATEADARRRWEEQNPGTWDRFSSAVHYAWERGRGRRAA
jgi:uncharacterized protein (TIGR02271 family)